MAVIKGIRNQLPLFVPNSDWSPPSMTDLPSWAAAKAVAIDVETYDPQLRTLGIGVRRGGQMVGVSFSIEDGPSFYLPFGHKEGPNLPKGQVIKYLRDQAAVFKGDLVGANMGYDLDYLLEDGVDFKPRHFRDIQVAEPLLNENKDSYSFESIARDHGLPGKNEHLLREAAAAYGLDPKKELALLPSRFVGPYATQDTVGLHAIRRRQERLIDEQDLWKIYDLESELLPVLVRMRRRGVRVDQDRLAKVEAWSRQREQEVLDKIRHASGVTIAPNTCHISDVVAQALLAVGLDVPAAKRKGYSVDKDWLAAQPGEVPKLVTEARKALKVRTTFVASIREHLTNGRIHCTINQLRMQDGDNEDDPEGGRYGRVSCVKPNMQQQPARDPEIGPMWRSIYIPEEGAIWTANDYSQQEPRWAVHFAVVAGQHGFIDRRSYEKAREAAQRYIDDRNTDNHQMMADMAGIKRKDAKEIYLGLSYGMGGAKLCRKLGLPTAMIVFDPDTRQRHYADSPEGRALLMRGERAWEGAGPQGQALLDTFDEKVPFLKRLAKACDKRAAKVGFIVTVGGRRCRFIARPDGGYDYTHKALNRLIQGSSADQTKRALVELDRAGHFIQLQVHDEIDGSVGDVAEARRMADVMESCVPCIVPAKCDVETGPSWGEAA